jgi:hypothetical protein
VEILGRSRHVSRTPARRRLDSGAQGEWLAVMACELEGRVRMAVKLD